MIKVNRKPINATTTTVLENENSSRFVKESEREKSRKPDQRAFKLLSI